MRGSLISVIALLVIAIFVWVGYGIYESVAAVEVNPNAESLVRPIPATFNQELFSTLEDRIADMPVETTPFHEIEEQVKGGEKVEAE